MKCWKWISVLLCLHMNIRYLVHLSHPGSQIICGSYFSPLLRRLGRLVSTISFYLRDFQGLNYLLIVVLKDTPWSVYFNWHLFFHYSRVYLLDISLNGDLLRISDILAPCNLWLDVVCWLCLRISCTYLAFDGVMLHPQILGSEVWTIISFLVGIFMLALHACFCKRFF